MNRLDTLALCWRLERQDGAGLALTSHDRSVIVDGIVHNPAPGLLPASVRRRGGLNPGSADIDGAISAAGLSETDLELGRWNGAAVRLDLAQWADDGWPPVNLASGEIGEVAVSGAGFTAELAGPTAALDAPVCPATSSECRATLGDRQCRVDMAGRRRSAVVVSCAGERITAEPAATPEHGGGRVIVVSGPSCGWSSPIVAVTEGVMVLREAPRLGLAPGTRLWIEEGCDKRFETCRTRFANALNFRGEPHLPGNDLLTRYPGG